MQGDNRAAALQAMPSSMISTVDTISNPGAQYSSSSGTILNINTFGNLPKGGSGSLSGQALLNGGYAVNSGLNYHVGRWSMSGFLSNRDTDTRSRSGSNYQSLDSSGNVTRTTQSNSSSLSNRGSISGSGSIEYTLTEKDTLSAQLSYNRNASHSTSLSNTAAYGPSGAATDVYSSVRAGVGESESQSVDLTWTHAGKQFGDKLTVDAQLSRALSKSQSESDNSYSFSIFPGNVGIRPQASNSSSNTFTGIFSVDYSTSFGDDKLNAGAQVNHIDFNSDYQTLVLDPLGSGALVSNTQLTSGFVYGQTLSAAYITYQKPLGDRWAILGGIRSETLDLDTEQLTTGARVRVRYTNLIPSIYATYVLSDKAKFRFNYAYHLTRPNPSLLNQAVRYVDDQNVSAGSTQLKPQETNSFEANYEFTDKTLSYQVRSFYTKDDKVIVPVSVFIPDPLHPGNQVVLTSNQNAGTRQQTGLQLNYNNRFGKQWNVNANATASVTDFQTPNIPGTQSLTSLGGRISIGYRTADSKNSITTYYQAQGKQLTGQGSQSGYTSMGMLYSHSITKKTSFVVVVNDILHQQKFSSVTRSPIVHSSSSSSSLPTIYVGLTHSFSFGQQTAGDRSQRIMIGG
jgi:outer membrane receptor protein involved in Fe transport